MADDSSRHPVPDGAATMRREKQEEKSLEKKNESDVVTAGAVPIPTQLELTEWVESLGGGLTPGAVVQHDPLKGQNLRVKEDSSSGIASGTCVARCPIVATMSYLNLKRSVGGLPPHSFVYNQKFLDVVEPDIASAFFLMDQSLQGEKSFWAPYIRSLPSADKLTTTQYYDGEDLKWLGDTNLDLARENRLKSWNSKYDQGLILLSAAENRSISSYTWDRFLWALTIISSRGFSSKVLASFYDGLSSEKDVFSVLVPLLDLANHRPLTKVEWRAGKDEVGLRILEDIQPGKEIYNNYGPKNNESLMMGYGFCMGENTCDFRQVNLKAPPGTPLFDARMDQKREFLGMSDDQRGVNYFIFNVFYPFGGDEPRKTEEVVFSRDLLDAVGILGANPREINAIKTEANRLHIPSSAYGGSRSVLTGLTQLQFELFAQVIKFRMGDFLDRTPENDKQRNAKTYREAQLMQTECALVVTSWALTRAMMVQPVTSKEELLETHVSSLQEKRFGLPLLDRVRSIIRDRDSILKHDGELFLNESVLATLPSETAECIRDFLGRIIDVVSPVFDESQLPVSVDMVAYCIFIRFCVATYRNLTREKLKTVLGSRILRWIPYILENHPEPARGQEWMVEDSDVDYLLTGIHHELELLRGSNIEVFEPIEAFTGPWLDDDGWLSRGAFRWGWYAAEDEIVQVAKDPLRYVIQPGAEVELEDLALDEMAGDWYLYIPHEVETERG